MNRLKLALYLACIFAAGLGVRTYKLGWSLPNAWHVVTYNCDEYTSLSYLEGMNPSKLQFMPYNKTEPGTMREGTFHLYTYAAALKALSAAGLLKLTPDKNFYYTHIGEWAKFFMTGRLLSVFYGLLTVLAMYFLANRMYGQRTALLGAFFLAVLPAHAVHSRYLLMNVPGVFWIVLAFYFLKDIMESGRPRDYVLAGMAIGLAISTRYSAGPLVLLLPLAHFLGGRGKNHGRLALGFGCAAFFFVLGTPYSVLAPAAFLKGLTATASLAAGAQAKLSLPRNIAAVFASFRDAFGLIPLLVYAAGAVTACVKRSKDDLLLLAWVGLLCVFFVSAGEAATPGRMLPALPFIALLGARGADLAWMRSPWAGRAALAAVAAHALFFYTVYFRLLAEPDIRDTASAWMADNIKPGSTIGLLREPSWFSPGLIDRKYRHPDHAGLPNYGYTRLTSGKWEVEVGFQRLETERPDYIVVTELESRYLPGGDFSPIAVKYGYREIQKFKASLSLPGLRLKDKVPDMFYTPGSISVYKKG
ncbi:MAG TPA: hypothetical protein DCS63_08995 [Elusimicrobia bacterium]|nr:hypothetical protein [Elusimicrobiota bacterium]